jgi:hypothetical protein
MHLQHFDVEFIVERFRHALHQRREQIDAKRHVAGLHDHRFLRGGLDPGLIVVREPGGADDVYDTALRHFGDQVARRGRHGEIDHGVGVQKCSRGIRGDHHADLAGGA